MIEITNLTFDYPGHRALNDVTLTVANGSVTALVGPNGAGKTTLMRCIAGLETPLTGTITVADMDVSDRTRDVHRVMGYLSDFFGLYQDLTVARCLEYAAAAQGLPEADIPAAIERTARQLNLIDRLQQTSGSLSRGLRQRVAIGQAIIHQPKVLLLDEPASGLDPEARASLATLFRQLQADGMTLLVSSHILSELDEYSTHMLALRDTCATNMGSRLLANWLHHPLRDRATLQARLDAVEQLLLPSPSGRGAGGEGRNGEVLTEHSLTPTLSQGARELYPQVHDHLNPSVDVERITARIALRSARPRDLSGLRDTLLTLPQLHAALGKSDATLIRQLADAFLLSVRPEPVEGSAQRAGGPENSLPAGTPVNPSTSSGRTGNELVELLQKTLKPEPSSILREGGVIADGFDPELDELRGIQTNCGDFLMELELRERARTGIDKLKVEYNRVHGFYIEVSFANADKVPDDYRRRQTLKNVERYITPELKAFEDKALSANDRALAREKFLYEQLLDQLAPFIPQLQRIAAAIAELDVLATFAERAATLNFSAPQFADDARINIAKGRHPVVEAQVDQFTPNDTTLNDARRTLLITGPNMGGKSTYMRQVAIIALLAHVGCFVPAQAAVLGEIDQIFTRIGASDDLASGRSTFMVEMTEAANILHNATEKSLVLVDEIGRGTSTFDGLALAYAIARHLLEKNRSYTLFATHYFELTRLAEEFAQLANVHLAAIEHQHSIVFLHSVNEGAASQSYGLQVAALAGVPNDVIRAAKKQLLKLEQNSAAQNLQGDLFDKKPELPEPEEHPVLQSLRDLQPDELSPKEALELIYQLKKLV
ncbi:DNA mismatch repair protein MutS [Sideroxydans sp. CL21]|uniref:DNA mismatch repair protein MutS n=1 Tax=Sideroxydans sp. CL21 TaxID=2600596 RepID=UPI0012AA334E|nr:DNA mismatch repair protein MutS [Sideroxydans sp. CL21]VVC82742.1 DNA mismatch repair protein MutS [Sideroxydans sp. CL21]